MTTGIDAQWRELVTTALLCTDRRDPPEPVGLIADVVADTARPSPSERMLAHVAAIVAVRRAAVMPSAPATPLVPPDHDDRPECEPSAVERWYHVTSSWPVLEDEWTLTLIGGGWRLAAELVPVALRRHRTDPVRHARVVVAAGAVAGWLIGEIPELGPSRHVDIGPEDLAELPELPIPPELTGFLAADGHDVAGALASGIADGDLGHAHRGVMVNLLARIDPAALAPIADALDAVDPMTSGAGLASVLGDLARTRRRMLDELAAPATFRPGRR